nr:cellulase family glycosylhydrolase [uncultured Sphaerochaeta sp.]
MSKIRGVNLGEWLVLEKWMDTSVFNGTTATDEDELCRQLQDEEKNYRFRTHRDTFIREEDIAYIKSTGMNAIRLPVPHFLFGDDPSYCDPYIPCITYVDTLFNWAETYGLGVIIDIHTAPDSQNGYDNGGICGVSKWAQKPQNISRMLNILQMLAERYGKRKSLLGIELLNEPASEEVWERNKRKYIPHDPARASGSSFVPISTVFDFYTRGYERLRKYLPENKFVVFHDAFRFNLFFNFFKESRFTNVLLDSHWYLDMEGVTEFTSTNAFLNTITVDYAQKIKEMQTIVPMIIGEWSLPHNIQRDVLPPQKHLSYRLMASALLYTWETAYGHFFWNYKVRNWPQKGWDFKECIEKGWLPSMFGEEM